MLCELRVQATGAHACGCTKCLETVARPAAASTRTSMATSLGIDGRRASGTPTFYDRNVYFA